MFSRSFVLFGPPARPLGLGRNRQLICYPLSSLRPRASFIKRYENLRLLSIAPNVFSDRCSVDAERLFDPMTNPPERTAAIMVRTTDHYSSRRVPAKLTHTSYEYCVDKFLDKLLTIWHNG